MSQSYPEKSNRQKITFLVIYLCAKFRKKLLHCLWRYTGPNERTDLNFKVQSLFRRGTKNAIICCSIVSKCSPDKLSSNQLVNDIYHINFVKKGNL